MAMTTPERDLEEALVAKLRDLKYEYRTGIRDRATLEANFRKKFEALNRVTLTDGEFQRFLEEIVKPNVYEAARSLRNRETFIRADGTPLNYTLVNIRTGARNDFEVVNQLRINTDNSHHRYDVMLLINGIPVVQIELKTLGISPRRAMEQIVDYKNDPGNGYTKTLLCFVQLFIVSNRTDTWYFANNNAKHFVFDADERFLPVYQFAAKDNTRITHLDDFADQFLAKCTLGQMIGRYMVLIASEQKLLMMRPVPDLRGQGHRRLHRPRLWQWLRLAHDRLGQGRSPPSRPRRSSKPTRASTSACSLSIARTSTARPGRSSTGSRRTASRKTPTPRRSFAASCPDDYADKVIVTTIQKLGLALDENSKHNKQNRARRRSTFKQQLERLRDKRMVFIFDECHRSQFGENHKAIKDFFPNSQLFGFTGTPIFEDNATVKQIEGEAPTLRTTKDLFQKELHAYTITHAIEDRNVLRFHIDYYRPKDAPALKPGLTKQAVVQTILDKHDAATGGRRFNALLATASINDAMEYYEVFQKRQAERQAERQAADPEFVPLKIAAVFSPPAEGNKDVQQIQEDLPQEKEDNRHDPEGKKTALKAIIADYNQRYGANHDINNFDLYYQDIQQRIKYQQFPNRDLPRKGQEKIDITIVVDMLLTGFDSKFLNTLYVDKNLRHHGLIQAFSRTNRVLNATKPYGHILDFRQQQNNVDAAIALFSGAQADQAREIWLVDKAPVVIDKFKRAVADLGEFMRSQGLEAKPDQVNNLKGDDARAQFIKRFKEVQRLQTQLDQYTDLTGKQRAQIEQTLAEDDLRAFRVAYLETSQRLKEQQAAPGRNGEMANPEVDQLDFEFVLFASAVIDYDYIMKLIARYSGQDPKKLTISREQLIGLIRSDAKFLDERKMITEYVRSLNVGEGLDETAIRAGYEQFKARKQAGEIADLAQAHGLTTESLATFVDTIIQRMIFDGEQLTDLMAPLDLGWRERRERELALMADLVPLLNKRAHGREISGLNAYEHGGVR